MRLNRRNLSRVLLVAALATTLLFVLSALFSFGIATHRSDPSWSWDVSAPDFGLVQLYFGSGQFHLTVDRAPPQGYDGAGEGLRPRDCYAGIRWLPQLSLDVRDTDRVLSKMGFDGFGIRSGTYGSVGVFGAYPAALLWLAWWMARVPKRRPGHCRACGYDMRATPAQCPECGTAAKIPSS